jgi:hypothetical protein
METKTTIQQLESPEDAMKQIYLSIALAFILVACLGFACASDMASLPPQKQYDTVIVWQACDNSTYSNITSIKNGAVVILGDLTAMPAVHDDYYEYAFTNNSLLGTNVVNGFCDENGLLTSWAYSWETTSDGQGWSTGTTVFIIFVVFSLIMLILSFIFQNNIIAFISGLSFLVTGVYSLVYGFTTSLVAYTQMMSYIIICLGIIITLISVLDLIGDVSEGPSLFSGGNVNEEGEED